MSKFKFFACHKFSDYARQCPTKKKGKGKTVADASTHMDELAKKFKKEFSLVSYLSSTIIRWEWVVDGEASRHITESHEIFTNMAKEHRDLHVELENTKYAVEGIGNIQFQLESRNLMEVKEVKYVPRLEKNLLSFSIMEDKELEINFTGGEVVVMLKGTDPSMRQVISNGENNLYMLTGQPVKVLVYSSDSQNDIWRKRMRHLYYRDLPLLRERAIGFLEFSVEHDGV